MLLTIGWGLGYLVTKGVQKLLGNNTEEVVEELRDYEEDNRRRYFGFEEAIPEDQSDTEASTIIVSSISGVVTSLTTFTPEDIVALESICGLHWDTCSGDADEEQSDMDASANLVSATSGVLTSLATINPEDTVASESICGLDLETCPGDADTDVCKSVEVPLEKMVLAVEASCDGREDPIHFEQVYEDSLVEETSSADGNSKDRVQNYADHFDGMDAAYMDDSPKEIPSTSTIAHNVVAQFEVVSEHSTVRQSSSEIFTEDDIDFSENYDRRGFSSKETSVLGYLDLENYVPYFDRISECSSSEEIFSEESLEHDVQPKPQHHESMHAKEMDVSFEEVRSESRNAGNFRSRVSKWLRRVGSRLANLRPRRKN
ncbi:uncharacterized protein LOC107835338 isoform X1 [Poecilia formosa]|uniref:uncharacterized protein LOC107835338 isoform X1 n=1 Tax=Poecilia formosa TaxID=48698 RepID=UPI0007BA4B19|nr:PREDICTED: uncharacterized protein LOC107835338 isoform X1 [Poecilia formosa]